ncbi:MAG: hypothetical protein ACRYF5_02245 [Janthinobacterium lividum]
MCASKTKKIRPTQGILRYAPRDALIPERLGGGILKELVEQDCSGKLLHYAVAYINPLIFAGDNGRVLGYDNAHGYPHRHYFGTITPEPDMAWVDIRARFEQEWRMIALDFLKGNVE